MSTYVEGTNSPAKLKILLVEDEAIVAMDVQERLRSLGYTVPAVASTGKAAIQKAAEAQPDLVLMDIKLKGGMDGIQAADEIRGRFDIPIVYLTALSDEATLQRAKATGPFGYLRKPFDEGELRTAIEIALYKHKSERKVKESEQWLATILNSMGDGVIATNAQGRIEFINPVAQELTGWRQEEAAGNDSTQVLNIINAETRGPAENSVTRVLRDGLEVGWVNHTLLIAKDGTEIPIDEKAAPITDDQGAITGVVLILKDISQWVRLEEARENLITELQETLAQVKTLSGLLPICTSCKQIRDDQGYWHQLENYLRDHSDTEFTHGICPDCARKLYPQIYGNIT
jgi:PAS domain S-box-containing protein